MSMAVKSDKTFEEIVERLAALFRLKPRPGDRDYEPGIILSRPDDSVDAGDGFRLPGRAQDREDAAKGLRRDGKRRELEEIAPAEHDPIIWRARDSGRGNGF